MYTTIAVAILTNAKKSSNYNTIIIKIIIIMLEFNGRKLFYDGDPI